jgi:hypothetical protein
MDAKAICLTGISIVADRRVRRARQKKKKKKKKKGAVHPPLVGQPGQRLPIALVTVRSTCRTRWGAWSSGNG